jgi:hypothetical protein
MPREQADFFVSRPVMEVWGYLSTLPSIAGIKVDYVDPQRYQIKLSKGFTLMSYGENITISFYDANGTTRIIAESSPKMPTQLIDGGVNRKNVETIQQFILSIFNR